MDALGLVDTFGVLTPQAVPLFVRAARAIADVPLEAHFHMDASLGVANTIVALAHGAEVVQTTISGIGERAGNTPLEDVALALLMHYGVDLGLHLEKLCDVSALVLERAKVAVAPNRPVVGTGLTKVESGIIAAWFERAYPDRALSCMPFLPQLVGQQEPELVLGKGSGTDSVRSALRQLGLDASEDQALELLGEVKRTALQRKELISLEEFRRVANSVLTMPSAPEPELSAGGGGS
jgi:isopropylmalate/homocitrate/citramalate synthase